MSRLKLLGAACAILAFSAPALAAVPAHKAAPFKGDAAVVTWKAPATKFSDMKVRPRAKPAARAATDVAVNTSVTIGKGGKVIHRVITNGPVPDTPQNRDSFGGPMSRGGAMTDPVGN